jgi:hypothetical protein
LNRSRKLAATLWVAFLLDFMKSYLINIKFYGLKMQLNGKYITHIGNKVWIFYLLY